MKTKQKKEKPRESLFYWLHKTMHNWFEISVVYDWEDNKETGKVWRYKDCTGIVVQHEDWTFFEEAIRKIKK